MKLSALLILALAAMAHAGAAGNQTAGARVDPPASHVCVFTLSSSKLHNLKGSSVDVLLAAVYKIVGMEVDLVVKPNSTAAGAYIKGIPTATNRAFCNSLPDTLPALLPKSVFGQVSVRSVKLLPLTSGQPDGDIVTAAASFTNYGRNCGQSRETCCRGGCGTSYSVQDTMDSYCWEHDVCLCKRRASWSSRAACSCNCTFRDKACGLWTWPWTAQFVYSKAACAVFKAITLVCSC